MNEDMVYFLGKETIKVAAMIATPLLLSSLVIGLLVSIFQAITQINEATLTFIPKILIIAIVLVLLGPWMLDEMTRFTVELFDNIATYVR
ncbi:MAG: flagellar biosynthesis protein FliQ [Bdellovibrionales bacterium]|nr:flagellar biosynthesis protein FliQ [Bdellovibrionales bacterium]